ncbi:MAG: hypothetical protein NTZ16_13105 [Verrucomicrobia bacterium]|nr:hypothetical protein [Verrucomicrobiota bacterium]
MISEPQTKSHSGQPVSVPAPGKLTLFLTRQQWVLAVVVGGLLAVCLQRYYENISPWIGGMLFLLGVITVHLRYASRFIVPFPHIALLMGALQYVLAAWISTQYPSDNPAYNIGSRIPTYLGYAVPVMVACMIGWGIGLARLRPSPPAAVRAAPDLLIGLDMLIVVGFIGVVLARHFQGTGLAFIFVLTANLRYVGALGRMLCKGSGWTWRLGLVLSLEVLFAAKSAMFHGLILWTVWTLALWVILFKPSWGKLTAVIAAAFLLLPALQESKWELRRHLEQEEQGGGTVTENSFEKSLLWLSYLRESVQTTITGNLDEYFIAETVVRYNQGWIVDRVMQIVPEGEPYARGETIKDAFVASLLPRFIMPNKVIAGGRANMEKYAGIQLN